MQQQAPDVNLAALSGILNKSKQYLDTTPRSDNHGPAPSSGGGYSPAPSGGGMREKPLPTMNEMLAAKGIKTNIQVPQYENEEMYESAVESSNLPPHIKKLMAEHRIEQPVDKGNPIPEAAMKAMAKETGKQSQPAQPAQSAPVNERYQPQSVQGNVSGFSRDEMKQMIKEVLSEMMMENISETTIKRTLKKMMTEGKLKVKK